MGSGLSAGETPDEAQWQTSSQRRPLLGQQHLLEKRNPCSCARSLVSKVRVQPVPLLRWTRPLCGDLYRKSPDSPVTLGIQVSPIASSSKQPQLSLQGHFLLLGGVQDQAALIDFGMDTCLIGGEVVLQLGLGHEPLASSVQALALDGHYLEDVLHWMGPVIMLLPGNHWEEIRVHILEETHFPGLPMAPPCQPAPQLGEREDPGVGSRLSPVLPGGSGRGSGAVPQPCRGIQQGPGNHSSTAPALRLRD